MYLKEKTALQRPSGAFPKGRTSLNRVGLIADFSNSHSLQVKYKTTCGTRHGNLYNKTRPEYSVRV
jgi:hypothetical protein